tara:strand:+ start:2668 stop:2904 length:237 start_codon:yes stop_codon:yes gene_type:complete
MNTELYIKYIAMIFAFFWITSGILSFIMSLLCFLFSGKKINNIIGLLIASVFFGPFYWFYYIYIDNYCDIKPIYKFLK